VSVFRSPSNFSNGNTFDPQGRQIACEHASRRVVRYEHDGSVTVIAESYQGKRLNSPNDVGRAQGRRDLVSPIRRTATQLYEGGATRAPAARAADQLLPRRSVGRCRHGDHRRAGAGSQRAGVLARLPRLYVSSTGKGPATRAPGGQARCTRSTWAPTTACRTGGCSPTARWTDVKCGPDGLRCDVDGNVWCASNAGRVLGYSGVTVWNPAGKLLGASACPRSAATSRSAARSATGLFMAASQSIYALYVGTQGAYA
jgi:gluconolactonase